ncbi:hypothetical protein [Vibrio sp. Hal054]|uniref:hypothetical protein n=1 Tax=Vibrio sp. Hal054 TaxID=3035158 RepID=UPI00301CD3FD
MTTPQELAEFDERVKNLPHENASYLPMELALFKTVFSMAIDNNEIEQCQVMEVEQLKWVIQFIMNNKVYRNFEAKDQLGENNRLH